MARLMRTYSDAGDLQDRIVALGNSGKILPNNDESPYDYLERLYHLAKVQVIQEDKDYDQLKTRFDQMKSQYEAQLHEHLVQKPPTINYHDYTVDMGSAFSQSKIGYTEGVRREVKKKAVLQVEKPRARMLRIKKKS